VRSIEIDARTAYRSQCGPCETNLDIEAFD